ncbi:hypothetical protein [Flavobacterium sp.]|uniref:hypothetical protein n=1 Tax=Flavobacterium sp. TaxID=239 RepID=UPI002628A0FA|nr:hypothetical protein [Flavobacterium sp.]MDG2433310.1 hypothetical protein [Flavobacterium sp.]
MKKLKVLLILALVVMANSVSAQSTFDKWPAIKEFHDVISATFHPAEEGNLAPIKARSEEMMTKAAALLTAPKPAEFKTRAIVEASEKLKLQSIGLNALIMGNGSNDSIVKELTEMHDVFHEIVGLCSESKK